ncbi:MAG: 16S rRNA (guanine(527)-N(7))-methyltransferase RsmG [Candidatus Acidiferrales bacterium]|jgi:16S rRNA (guanine527-N7)-methyltransferase
MLRLSVPAIRSILQSYDLSVPDLLCEKIQSYTELLLKWNRRISLTSIENPEEIVRYHFAESFLATKACESLDGRLADVGTGAGFPGLALKMYVPTLQVSLIESNSKKCAFLAEAVRLLQLDGVKVIRSRYEEILAPEAPFDFVTARALGNLPSLLNWAANVTPIGRALLWLGTDGIDAARSASTHWAWSEHYSIPQTNARFILVGLYQNER